MVENNTDIEQQDTPGSDDLAPGNSEAPQTNAPEDTEKKLQEGDAPQQSPPTHEGEQVASTEKDWKAQDTGNIKRDQKVAGL